MAEYKYCYRQEKYKDDEFFCLACVSYVDIFTGERIDYKEFDASDPKQCELDMRGYESNNNYIINDESYPEDVELILNDFRLNHGGMQISLYVHDVIDLIIPLSVFVVSDILDIIDIISFNTPDDILIGITYDTLLPIFEFYG